MPLPEHIGPYRPERRLGAGGMGEVFLARDRRGRPVAVKAIRADLAHHPGLKARLLREIRTMERVRGSHVAELVDADGEAATPYLVTRYVPGPTLSELVAENGPLRDEALRRFAWSLARALESIHSAGCVHRDLKPGNVIMSGGEPVVIDFGIAHALGDTRFTVTGKATGTPGYMAPELLADGEAGTAVDVFAWGATVAFAGTGRRAYWAQLTPEATERLLAEAAGIPRDLRKVVLGALAADPAHRPSSTFLPALLEEPVRSVEPRSAMGLSGVGHPDRGEGAAAPRRRHGTRALFGAVAAGTAIALGGTGWWWSGRADSVGAGAGPSITSSVTTGPATSTEGARIPENGILAKLPKTVCETVSSATFLHFVPDGEVEEYGGQRAGSCSYTSRKGGDDRYLRLETRIVDTRTDLDPITLAKWSFVQDYAESQRDNKTTDNLLLEKVQGLGEEAFRRVFTVGGAENVVTARVETRISNVVIAVFYSRPYERRPEEQQNACLEGATAVVQEALASYT